MLRWILIMLVLANTAYFGWHRLSDKPYTIGGASAGLAEIPNDQGGITLLREALSIEPSRYPQTRLDQAEEDIRPLCWMIGPFKEELGAEQIKNRFEALNMTPTLSSSSHELAPIYWVYIEPLADKAAALRLSNTLRSRGIDSYVILSEEELVNGISLGFFVNLEAAEKIKAAHKGQPYRVAIKKVNREKKELWAVLPTTSVQQLTDELWARLGADWAGLEKKQNYCDLVVSGEQFE